MVHLGKLRAIALPAAVAVVLICAVLTLLLLWGSAIEYGGVRGVPFLLGKQLAYSNSPFDVGTWQASREPSPRPAPSPRYLMARSLVEVHLKKGMPQQAVRALLGPPDQVSHALPGSDVDHYWTYVLGAPFSDLTWHDWYLHLGFDSTGNYLAYRITEDIT